MAVFRCVRCRKAPRRLPAYVCLPSTVLQPSLDGARYRCVVAVFQFGIPVVLHPNPYFGYQPGVPLSRLLPQGQAADLPAAPCWNFASYQFETLLPVSPSVVSSCRCRRLLQASPPLPYAVLDPPVPVPALGLMYCFWPPLAGVARNLADAESSFAMMFWYTTAGFSTGKVFPWTLVF